MLQGFRQPTKVAKTMLVNGTAQEMPEGDSENKSNASTYAIHYIHREQVNNSLSLFLSLHIKHAREQDLFSALVIYQLMQTHHHSI